eukprot:GSMAST32.ASY1.ANO1.347.1 assembled CDS
MRDIAHLLRPAHLQQLRNILDDSEATSNDKFVALELLKNACIASGFILPGCQDTGTGIVFGKRGHNIITGFDDEAALSHGVFDTYTETNLRYSQVAPLSMYDEKNTGCNLPAQIDTYAVPGSEYNFGFIAKGGGSANKTFLFQQTKALLNPDSMMKFLEEKIKTLGTAAWLSAELTLKTVKMASIKYLDNLPTTGSESGRAFRDLELESRFGGKYFCHDVRVVRLPRHVRFHHEFLIYLFFSYEI